MLAVGLLATALVAFVLGHVLQGVGLVAVGLGGSGCALWARRPASRDVTRLNALEWRDERDRRLGKDALSVVGASALGLSVAALVVTSIVGSGIAVGIAYAQLLVLLAVWALADSVAVRRG